MAASSSSSTSTNENLQYRKNMQSVVSFIRKKRKEIRKKTTFNPPDDFVNIDKINNSDYALDPEKLNFFYNLFISLSIKSFTLEKLSNEVEIVSIFSIPTSFDLCITLDKSLKTTVSIKLGKRYLHQMF